MGLAVLVTVAATVTSDAPPNSPNPTEALVHGYNIAFLVNAAVMLVSGLAALALPKAQQEDAT